MLLTVTGAKAFAFNSLSDLLIGFLKSIDKFLAIW